MKSDVEPLSAPTQCERRRIALRRRKVTICPLPAAGRFQGKALCERDISWARCKARDEEQVRKEREALEAERRKK